MQTLKVECTKLFCLDVRREVPVAKIQVCLTVVHIMIILSLTKADDNQNFKTWCQRQIQVCTSFGLLSKQNEYLSIWRKKKGEYGGIIIFIGKSLKWHDSMTMHAPPEVKSQYQKNVALLVRFMAVFYVQISLWLYTSYAEKICKGHLVTSSIETFDCGWIEILH